MFSESQTEEYVNPAKKKISKTKTTKAKVKDYQAKDRKFVDESTYSQRRINRFFENEFYDPTQVKSNYPETGVVSKVKPTNVDVNDPDEDDWEVKTTSKGFIYFKLRGTNKCQWEFPRIYDFKTKKYKSVFLKHWIKLRNAQSGIAFWK